MPFATGVGSMPGDDQPAYDEAVRVVLGELPELPHLPEVPGRGATASMTGRALAVVAELGADLQPAGWRLTDASGIDQRRARSLLAQDLDTLEEAAEGYVGAFKVQVAGPWTLAATVERPRGDKILADHGARRDLAQALAEGVRDHVRDLRRRLPGVERLVVQVDEPALALVLAGAVPTASGFGRHRTVDRPEASETPRLGARRDRRRGRRTVGAQLLVRNTPRPRPRRRCARAVGRPRPAGTGRPRRAGRSLGGGGARGPRDRSLDRRRDRRGGSRRAGAALARRGGAGAGRGRRSLGDLGNLRARRCIARVGPPSAARSATGPPPS